MITTPRTPFAVAAFLAAAAPLSAQTPAPAAPAPGPLVEVVVTNPAAFARTEMVEVAYKQIPGLAKIADLAKVHVFSATGKEVLAQGVDTDGDYDDDVLVFQAELAANGAAKFKLALGDARKYKKDDFRVNGRFVRERFDDFAWENDKVAFRMYGEALETWVREPLTSSTVDAWVKKTPKLTINDWYLVDDYHHDNGEGGDFYSAGKTRGCGGSGLLAEGKLAVTKNFRASRLLSRGPIRLVFELTYLPFEVGTIKVSEVKRVTLDAGSNFNKFESFYRTESGAPLPETVLWATGIKKEKTADLRPDAKAGVVRSWQELTAYSKDGWMGCALVVDPARAVATPELDGNVLLTFRGPSVYYAGTGWDRSGDFKTMADFDAHVEAFAKRVATPIRVEVTAAR